MAPGSPGRCWGTRSIRPQSPPGGNESPMPPWRVRQGGQTAVGDASERWRKPNEKVKKIADQNCTKNGAGAFCNCKKKTWQKKRGNRRGGPCRGRLHLPNLHKRGGTGLFLRGSRGPCGRDRGWGEVEHSSCKIDTGNPSWKTQTGPNGSTIPPRWVPEILVGRRPGRDWPTGTAPSMALRARTQLRPRRGWTRRSSCPSSISVAARTLGAEKEVRRGWMV